MYVSDTIYSIIKTIKCNLSANVELLVCIHKKLNFNAILQTFSCKKISSYLSIVYLFIFAVEVLT